MPSRKTSLWSLKTTFFIVFFIAALLSKNLKRHSLGRVDILRHQIIRKYHFQVDLYRPRLYIGADNEFKTTFLFLTNRTSCSFSLLFKTKSED